MTKQKNQYKAWVAGLTSGQRKYKFGALIEKIERVEVCRKADDWFKFGSAFDGAWSVASTAASNKKVLPALSYLTALRNF